MVGKRFLVPRQHGRMASRCIINCIACQPAQQSRVKVKTHRPFPLSTLNEEVKAILDRVKGVGTNLTFEGEYLADFVERLDKLVDVMGVRMDDNVFKILIGDTKTATPTEILAVVAKSTLLNVSAAGYEDVSHGKVLYFEFYIPPWNQTMF